MKQLKCRLYYNGQTLVSIEDFDNRSLCNNTKWLLSSWYMYLFMSISAMLVQMTKQLYGLLIPTKVFDQTQVFESIWEHRNLKYTRENGKFDDLQLDSRVWEILVNLNTSERIKLCMMANNWSLIVWETYFLINLFPDTL